MQRYFNVLLSRYNVLHRNITRHRQGGKPAKFLHIQTIVGLWAVAGEWKVGSRRDVGDWRRSGASANSRSYWPSEDQARRRQTERDTFDSPVTVHS